MNLETIFKSLARPPEWPSVSVYLAGNQPVDEKPRVAIMNKNLLKQIETDLAEKGEVGEQVLERILSETSKPFNSGGKTRVIFCSPTVFEAFEIPVALTPRGVVDRKFLLEPLIPFLDRKTYFLLQLHKDKALLYRGDCFGLSFIKEVSSEEAEKETPQSLQFRSREQGVPHYFSHKDISLEQENRTIRFFGSLIDEVVEEIGDAKTPVILAGSAKVKDHFINLSPPLNLINQHLQKNPTSLDVKELHSLCFPLVESGYYRRKIKQVGEQYDELAHTDYTTNNQAVINRAACLGAVKALLVDEGTCQDSALNARPRVSFAASQTLSHGGDVVYGGPEISGLGAILRFPVKYDSAA